MAESQSAPSTDPSHQPRRQTEQQSVRRTQLKLVVAAIIAIALIFGTLGAIGLFGTGTEQLAVTQVGFSYACSYQAIFTVTNTGPVDVTISQVQAMQVGVAGQLATTQLTGNTIRKGTSTVLTASFPGAGLVGGAVYNFDLITSRGASFSIGALAPSLTITDQLTTQVTFSGGSQVSFALSTSGACDVSILTVTVRGGGVNGTVTGTILSGGNVPAGGSSSMLVDFSGAVFNSGTRYFFVLITARGTRVPFSATA